jgi:hypothetical protein
MYEPAAKVWGPISKLNSLQTSGMLCNVSVGDLMTSLRAVQTYRLLTEMIACAALHPVAVRYGPYACVHVACVGVDS